MLRSHLVLGSLLLLGACKDKDSDSVEDGTITREQMQQRLDRMKIAESRRDKEDDR